MKVVVKIGETNIDKNVKKLLEILDGLTVTEIHDGGIVGIKDGIKIGVFKIEDEYEVPDSIMITYQRDENKSDSEYLYFPYLLWSEVCGIIDRIRDEAIKQNLELFKNAKIEVKEG